jgi:hypothetical protein
VSMPGFTAEQSLQPSLSPYHGGGSYALHDDLVEPEIFGFVKEAFESVGNAFSSVAQSLAKDVGNLVNSLQSGGGPGGQPFACGQWVTRMLACSGNSPTYSEAQMIAACISTNPAQMISCTAVTAALYSTLQQGCSENPNGIGQLLGQVCPNG